MTFLEVHDGSKPLMITTIPGNGSFPIDGDVPRSVGDVQHGDPEVIGEWDDDWTYATYVNGWESYGYGHYDARFRRMFGGYVRIEGLVWNGTPNTPIFYLPVGYRPTATIILYGVAAEQVHRIDINPAGAVTYPFTNTSTWHSVECTFWPG